MKRHHYAVMFLLSIVAVLTGFVMNTQQAPTRWEYASISRTLGAISVSVWIDGDSSVAGGLEEGLLGLGTKLGCEQWIYDCLGQRGWEMVGSHLRNPGTEQTWFKRPVQ